MLLRPSSCSSPGLLAVLALMVLSICPSANARRDKEPVLATSADDFVLRNQLAALAPSVNPEEARRVAYTAYTTGRDLRREWQVVWPPGLQNFLVRTGARKGGLCFQWAAELLLRLDALKLQTLELHWAEAYARTQSEHNVIVVTARGQPFAQGILLDNWRYSGRLAWGPVARDPHYEWQENKAEAAQRLQRKGQVANSPGAKPPLKTRPRAR